MGDDLLSQCTLILEAGENPKLLEAKLSQVFAQAPYPAKVVVVFAPGSPAKLPAGSTPCPVVTVDQLSLAQVATPFVAYLPAKAPYAPLHPMEINRLAKEEFILPWVPATASGKADWVKQTYADLGWIGSSTLIKKLPGDEPLSLLGLESFSRRKKGHLPYFAMPAYQTADEKPSTSHPTLSTRSRVLALVPYFNCATWLEQCLDSLVHQTRPPDAIAVLDDASTESALDVVKKFESVTLLRSSENVGPYRLLQSAIDQTQFDAYLFQDADDWSSRDRLELLLREAEQTGAEWIGTQEILYLEDFIYSIRHPLNLDTARQATLSHPFCYPSSLIAKDFLNQLGGFASGLRFGGDLELVSRAAWVGKVSNLDDYCYFRRIRKNSLITSAETGFGSQARHEVNMRIAQRKAENMSLAAKGLPPKLEPLITAAPIKFEYLAGPRWA